jgi:folate-binding protein YgfZ
VREIKPGVAAFGLALNRTGKIHSDLWLAAGSEQVVISVAPGTAAPLLQELQRLLIMEDAEIEQRQSLNWLTVHGPRAADVASQLGTQLQAVASGEIALLSAGDFVVAGAAADVAAAFTTGAVVGATLGDEAAWHALRIEHGLPLFGVDYDSRANPHDASLERRAVSWSKGCYLGQEVVCMQDMRGKPKHRFVALQVSSEASVVIGAAVSDEAGTKVGEVTSVAHSPRLGSSVVLAKVGVAAEAGELRVAGNPAQRLEHRAW